MKTIQLNQLNLVNHCVEWTLYHEGWDSILDTDGEILFDDNQLIEEVCYYVPGRHDDVSTDYKQVTLEYLLEDDTDLDQYDCIHYSVQHLDQSPVSLTDTLQRRYGQSVVYNEDTQTITYDDTLIDLNGIFTHSPD